MTALVEIRRRIESTSALIAEQERSMASAAPGEPNPLSVSIRALEKLRTRLEREFNEAAQEQEVEVYRYRILEAEAERTTLAGVAELWEGFQRVFSAVQEAIALTDKSYGSEPVAEFGYGYTFPGSVGVVVTLPRAYRNLLGRSQVEDATAILFDLIEGKETESLKERLGREPIEIFNQWISGHIDHGMGIGLDWNGPSGRRSVEVGRERLASVKAELAKTCVEIILEVPGNLVAVDTTSKRFRIRGDDKVDYEGCSGEVINAEHAASVPSRYVAKIQKVMKLLPGPNDKPEFRLVELRPMKPVDPQQDKAKKQ